MTAYAVEAVPVASDGDEAVAALRRFISRGEYGLREVPQLLREILEREYWRVRGSGFSAFEDFVGADPPPGLGTDIAMIRRLISHDTTTLDLLDQETVGPQGAHHDIVMKKRAGQGNDRQYALRRLRAERPDLHRRVLAKELSPHGAMVEAGFRPRAYRLPLTVDGLVVAIRRHFTSQQITELVRRLAEEG